MARITVEDCLPHIGNPFDLAMLAAERARQLKEGAPAAVSAKGRPEGHKAAAAGLEPLPVASTRRDTLFDEEAEGDADAEDRAA